MHKNFRNVDKVVFGRGSYSQLDEILKEKRNDNDKFMLFIVDKYFEGKDHPAAKVPAHAEDIVMFIDVDVEEPTTDQIDYVRDTVKAAKGIPAGIIGIGGGSIMD